jgi:hypothetical protein
MIGDTPLYPDAMSNNEKESKGSGVGIPCVRPAMAPTSIPSYTFWFIDNINTTFFSCISSTRNKSDCI